MLISILLRFTIVAHIHFGTYSTSNKRPTFAFPTLNPLFFWTTLSENFQTYGTVAVLIF